MPAGYTQAMSFVLHGRGTTIAIGVVRCSSAFGECRTGFLTFGSGGIGALVVADTQQSEMETPTQKMTRG